MTTDGRTLFIKIVYKPEDPESFMWLVMGYDVGGEYAVASGLRASLESAFETATEKLEQIRHNFVTA
jgi:hypothetical protein